MRKRYEYFWIKNSTLQNSQKHPKTLGTRRYTYSKTHKQVLHITPKHPKTLKINEPYHVIKYYYINLRRIYVKLKVVLQSLKLWRTNEPYKYKSPVHLSLAQLCRSVYGECNN